jgi:hypothetical protein
MGEAIITGRKDGLSLKISCVPFNPSETIGSSWFFWKGPKDGNGTEGEEERDRASLALVEVDFVKVDFFNCLKENETSISGEEKLVRLKRSGRQIYGTTAAMGLLKNYQSCQNKADSVLAQLYGQGGIICIDFFGDILLAPDGRRNVLRLCRRDDGSWHLDCEQLDFEWDGTCFSGAAATVQ